MWFLIKQVWIILIQWALQSPFQNRSLQFMKNTSLLHCLQNLPKRTVPNSMSLLSYLLWRWDLLICGCWHPTNTTDIMFDVIILINYIDSSLSHLSSIFRSSMYIVSKFRVKYYREDCCGSLTGKKEQLKFYGVKGFWLVTINLTQLILKNGIFYNEKWHQNAFHYFYLQMILYVLFFGIFQYIAFNRVEVQDVQLKKCRLLLKNSVSDRNRNRLR